MSILLHGILCLSFSLGVLSELNAPCSSHDECNSPRLNDTTPFSYCDSGICACHPWFYQQGTSCKRARYGSVCASFGSNGDNFCRDGVGDGAFCDTSSGRCKCQPGHKGRINHCGAIWCDAIGEGSVCTPGQAGDEDCQNNLGDDSATCHPESNVCLCGAGKQYIKSRKRCVPLLPAPVRDRVCRACIQTGGNCYSSEETLNTPYLCECPACKRTSPSNNWEEFGCDELLADLGEVCSVERGILCRDPHATCIHAHVLENINYCQCLPGYVEVCDTMNDPSMKKCAKEISRKDDRNCEQCWARGGRCYQDYPDPDNEIAVGIGCACPSHLTSSNPMDPTTFCDTELVNVTCSDESMKVCYDPSKHTRFPNITMDLMTRRGRLYIAHHDHDVQCHFQYDTAERKWCIQLDLRQKGRCGLETSRPSGSTISYTSNIVLQRQRYKITVNDFCVLVYCVFDTSVNVFNGFVVGKKFRYTHGLEISPELVMRVEDEYMKLPARTVTVGEKIRLCIEMTEDRNAYDAIQALVCVASNSRYLFVTRDIRSCLLIDEGCVTHNPYLTKLENFRPLPTDPKQICTGFFKSFRIGDHEKLFFHCAVKTCRNADDCRPNPCTANGRRKRSLADESDWLVEGHNVDHDGGLIRWRRAVDADQMIEAQKQFENPELNHQVVEVRVLPEGHEEEGRDDDLIMDRNDDVIVDKMTGVHVITDHDDDTELSVKDRRYSSRGRSTGNDEDEDEDDLSLLGKSTVLIVVLILVIVITFFVAACIYYKFCVDDQHPTR